MHSVFVYGTLRTGASDFFRMHGARSLGAATIQARLYRVHQRFPGFVTSLSPSDLLHGEVFTGVTEEHLHQLDSYEGCDSSIPLEEQPYRRIIVPATLTHERQTIKEVWAWEWIKPVSEDQHLPSGDWLKDQ